LEQHIPPLENNYSIKNIDCEAIKGYCSSENKKYTLIISYSISVKLPEELQKTITLIFHFFLNFSKIKSSKI